MGGGGFLVFAGAGKVQHLAPKKRTEIERRSTGGTIVRGGLRHDTGIHD